MVDGMQDSQLPVQPGGGSGDNNSGVGGDSGGSQRGQRKDRPIFPGQREEARANDDTQRRGGELAGGMCKTDDIFGATCSNSILYLFSIHFQGYIYS